MGAAKSVFVDRPVKFQMSVGVVTANRPRGTCRSLIVAALVILGVTSQSLASDTVRDDMKPGAWDLRIEVVQKDLRRDRGNVDQTEDRFCLTEEDVNRFMITPSDRPLENRQGMECERYFSEGEEGKVIAELRCEGRRQSFEAKTLSDWSSTEFNTTMLTEMMRGRNHIELQVTIDGTFFGECEEGMQGLDEAFMPGR